MGAAMARNLARAGLDVRAWNRTRSKAEPLGRRRRTRRRHPGRGGGRRRRRPDDAATTAPPPWRRCGRPPPRCAPGRVWAQATTAGLGGDGTARRVRPRDGLRLRRLARPRHQAARRERTAAGAGRRARSAVRAAVAAGLRRDRQPHGVGRRDGAEGAATRLKLVSTAGSSPSPTAPPRRSPSPRGWAWTREGFLDAVAGGAAGHAAICGSRPGADPGGDLDAQLRGQDRREGRPADRRGRASAPACGWTWRPRARSVPPRRRGGPRRRGHGGLVLRQLRRRGPRHERPRQPDGRTRTARGRLTLRP